MLTLLIFLRKQRLKDLEVQCKSAWNDPTDGSVLVIYSPQGVTSPSSIAETAIDLADQTRKTLLVALMGEDTNCQEARRMLHRSGIPAFRTPEEAVSAFMNMYTYTRNMELLYQTPEEVPIGFR